MQSLADAMRAHPYLGRAHASSFCGVYPAHDPIGERGIVTSLNGRPPALSAALLTHVTNTPVPYMLTLLYLLKYTLTQIASFDIHHTSTHILIDQHPSTLLTPINTLNTPQHPSTLHRAAERWRLLPSSQGPI